MSGAEELNLLIETREKAISHECISRELVKHIYTSYDPLYVVKYAVEQPVQRSSSSDRLWAARVNTA